MSNQVQDTVQARGNGSAKTPVTSAQWSTEYYNELIEFSADAMIAFDDQGGVELFNQAAEKLFDYSKEEAAELNFEKLVPDVPKLIQDKNAADHPEADATGDRASWREINGLHRDGTLIPLEIGIREFHVQGRRILTAIMRDLTVIKQIKAEIERKAQEVEELSTPAIAVWQGVLVLPLIGTLDSRRMQNCTERTLQRLSKENARVIIIDITGVPVMDTMVANHLISMASSIVLMGGKCILTGISPATAVAIVNLGLDLSTLETRSTLQEGLKLAIELVDGISRAA